MFWKKRIYLDQAAGVSANPSSPHEEGRRSREILEGARTDIARLLEVQTDDVIFTSGATESNALAILGIPKKGDHVLYLPSAHTSIVENAKLLNERGVEVEPLVIKDGRIDILDLRRRVRPNTKLIAVEAVCGETGIVWNTREVASALHEPSRAKRGIAFLHVDASQAPLTEKITRAHFGADTLTLDASKVGPVRGVGALIAHRTISIEPLYRGGGQERGLRSGSESPALLSEFAESLRKAVRSREAFRARAERARAELVKTIVTAVPNVYINEGRTQVPHILNISLLGRDTDYLVALLDEAGFSVSTRSACETDSEEGSRAVYALFNDAARAKATLRISWGPDVSKRDLKRFSDVLIKVIAFIDNSSRR